MLYRAAGNGDLSDGTPRCVDQDVRRRRGLLAHISFNVAVADLKVSDVSTPLHHAAPGVIADMRIADVYLMQVHMVEEYSDSTIFVNMTVGDDDITVPACQVDAVPCFANRQP